MVEFGPRFGPLLESERGLARARAFRGTRKTLEVPVHREPVGVVLMAAASGGGSGGGDGDESWRTEGVARARVRDMFEGVGKVMRRLGRFVNRALNLEFGGAAVAAGGTVSVGYGISLVVASGLSLPAVGLIIGGAVVVGVGYLIWRAGRWLSHRVDGVAMRTFERQARRRTKDYM